MKELQNQINGLNEKLAAPNNQYQVEKKLLEQQVAEKESTLAKFKVVKYPKPSDLPVFNTELAVLQQKIEEQQQYIQQVVDLCNNRLTQIEYGQQQVIQLTELAEDRHRQILHLNAQNSQLVEQNRQIQSKKTWRYTKPIRQLGGFLNRQLIRSTEVNALPLNQLESIDSKTWQATGDDPYFLLRPQSKHLFNSGWVWLSYEFSSVKGVEQEIYFDLGSGFVPELCLKFMAIQGRNRIPLYLPKNLKALRLDPQTGSGLFELHTLMLEKTSEQKDAYGVNDYLQTQDQFPWQLQPVHQLTADTERCGWWQSSGNDPHFMLKGEMPRAGWYMVELKVKMGSGQENARFYFDLGDELNERDSINLPLKDGRVTKRVCYFRQPPKVIRFDPMEREGDFNLQHLKFVKLTERFAISRMLTKLKTRHSEFQGQSTGQIRKVIDQRARQQQKPLPELMLEHYGDCFKVDMGQVSYKDWIARVESPLFADREAIASEIAAFTWQPLISVVMPTYNTDERLLRACIDSVINQSYSHWELCVADDNSPNSRVREVLTEYAEQDARIRTVFRTENGHISRATNSALEIVKGEFVALLDHDDELSTDALYCVVKALNDNPEAKIIYSDEDKIDEHGRRYEPHFKCDWNRDLLYSQNYISHLGVYDTSLLRDIGGFRTGVEGSQDYDLLLRSVARVKDHQIIHIPHVLYHWRAIEGSTALEAGEKSYTTKAGIKALKNYFAETGQQVRVEEGMVANTYRVRWPIPKPEPLVSLLIPTRDGYEILKQCVDSILAKTIYRNYEIIILDNQTSCEKTLGYFRSFDNHDKVRVLAYDQPFNYSAINNYGVKHAKGSIIGLINNDIEVISPEWLTEMVSHTLREDVGCVGAKLYYGNNTVQHAGVICGLGGVAGHSHKHFPKEASGYFYRLKLIQNLSAVTAAVLLVRRQVFEEVSGLNEQDLTVAFNDVDFCLKVREAGYRNLWTPYAELYHHESVSRGAEDNPEKIARFQREIDYMVNTWQDKLTDDPFYSRNLTMDREDFSITAS